MFLGEDVIETPAFRAQENDGDRHEVHRHFSHKKTKYQKSKGCDRNTVVSCTRKQ